MTFQHGESGNPAGRPKGIPDKRTKLRALFEPHAEALVAKAVELALEGDRGALKMCLDRLVPPYRTEDVPEELETSVPKNITVSWVKSPYEAMLAKLTDDQLKQVAEICGVEAPNRSDNGET